jgi:hypothetical protein
MRFEKMYMIDKWTDWNCKIFESIDDFFECFSYYPNIIEANNHTYSQFDFLINEIPNEKQRVAKLNDLTNIIEKPNSKEYVKISGFETMKASLEFAVDVKLKNKEFRLVYDSEPDWGDSFEIIDTPIEKLKKVKT